MEFGLFLQRKSPNLSPETMLEGLINQTEVARDSGFDLISIGEHFLVEEFTVLQSLPLLSRLSAVSGHMTIATSIILLPLHHPVFVAENLATLSVLAEDVIAGVGAGYRDKEFDSIGISKAERGPRLEEGIRLLNALWTDDHVTFDGEFYSVEDATLGVRPEEKPPIWVGANARVAVERAARLGDAWVVNPHATIEEIKGHKEAYDAIKEERGEDTAVPLKREVFVTRDEDEALEYGREYMAPKYHGMYADWGQDEAMEDKTDIHREFEDLLVDRFLLGTPEQVCEQIDQIKERLELSHLIVTVQQPGVSYERATKCVELIGDEVLPYV